MWYYIYITYILYIYASLGRLEWIFTYWTNTVMGFLSLLFSNGGKTWRSNYLYIQYLHENEYSAETTRTPDTGPLQYHARRLNWDLEKSRECESIVSNFAVTMKLSRWLSNIAATVCQISKRYEYFAGSGLGKILDRTAYRTKWPPYHRQHFQMHFLEWKVSYFHSNFTEVCS